MSDNGVNRIQLQKRTTDSSSDLDNFVLDKGIFSNIFEKDIRRVYLYKKSERLSKALLLIAPAFKTAGALRDRIESIAVGLVDASILPPAAARDALSRELLALSSVLSMARTAGILSPMNAELIAKGAHLLLKEVAGYEEPKLAFEDTPSLAMLARGSAVRADRPTQSSMSVTAPKQDNKGQSVHVKDKSDRRESIISVLKAKGPSYIKDISTVIREVSEKTIQRELQALVLEGRVTKEGERRWTMYTLVGA
jgi:hypothetical protein